MTGQRARLIAAAVLIPVAACGGGTDRTGTPFPPTAPTLTPSPAPPTVTGTTTVRFVYRAPTAPRADLPPSAQPCIDLVGRTHIHPGWRDFARVDMTAVGSDRWEVTFTDVPTNRRLSVRVSDGNACDENATGAATRNVFANDVLLAEIVPTPGSGTEPGLAFTVAADGRVSP